jgi:hypothetical protein
MKPPLSMTLVGAGGAGTVRWDLRLNIGKPRGSVKRPGASG